MDKIVRVDQDKTPHCPVCDHHLDCHTGAGHNKLPESGDVSICINCISVLVYDIKDTEIDLRLPTEEENEVFYNDLHIKKAIQIVKEIKAKAGGPN